MLLCREKEVTLYGVIMEVSLEKELKGEELKVEILRTPSHRLLGMELSKWMSYGFLVCSK